MLISTLHQGALAPVQLIFTDASVLSVTWERHLSGKLRTASKKTLRPFTSNPAFLTIRLPDIKTDEISVFRATAMTSVVADETLAGNGENGGPLMPGVQIGEDGIVRIDYRAYDRLTLGVVQQAYEKQLAVSQEKQRPVLIFGQNVMSLDNDVAEFVAGKEVKRLTKAAAILTKSFMEEQLGNTYLLFNAPPFPTRLFTSESGALRWLTGYVA